MPLHPVRSSSIKNLGVFIAALLAVLGWAITSSLAAVDHRYVHTDAFALYQAHDSARHASDAATFAGEMKDVRSVLFGLDSSDRCRRGQPGYCR